MKITPLAPQSNVIQHNTQGGSSNTSARERAVAALLKGAPQGDPNSTQAPKAAPSDDFERALAAKQAEEAQKPTSEESNSSEPVEPAESKAPEASEEKPLSPQHVQLLRREKALRDREKAFKAQQDEYKKSLEAAKAPEQSKAAFDETKFVSKEQLAKDPFAVLTEMGLSYDQLTELALNGPKPKEIELMNEMKAMREELKALKGETESTKKSFEEQQTNTYKQAVAQIKNEAATLVKNNPEFETIKETNSVDDVVELIEQTFKEDGILLTVEDAARQVEDYLLEEALKLAKIKKIQQRLAPKASPEASKQTAPQQQQLKTLTNSVGSSRTLSARERAIMAMEQRLNK